MSRKWIIPAALGLVLLVAGVGIGVGLLTPQKQPTRERVIIIPRGAAERIKKNPKLDLLPRRIDATVGERLVIVNKDTQGHLIGPFTVLAGERVEYSLMRAARYAGVCSLTGGSFMLVVHPASAKRQ